jgi:hypothetical protein
MCELDDAINEAVLLVHWRGGRHTEVRVARDQANVATLFKHLRFAGARIVTLAEGEISELHVGLKGKAQSTLCS